MDAGRDVVSGLADGSWRRKAFIVTFLVIGCVAWALPGAGAEYVDDFTPAPFTGIVTAFDTDALHYAGFNCDFYASVFVSALAINMWDPARFEITARGGGEFVFESMWVDAWEDIVISGSGSEPFSKNVSMGTVGTVGPTTPKRVSKVTVASATGAVDFDVFFDDVAVGFPPELTSFTRQTPLAEDTNADTLVFRATFDEPVQNVSPGDFVATGTTAGVTNVNPISASIYDLTVSGGDLAGYEGTVGIDLSGIQDIEDLAGNGLPDDEPTTDQTYELDNTPPDDPTPSSSSHTVSVWDNDDTIDIQVSGAADDGGSGVDGFEVEWSNSAAWSPTGTKEHDGSWAGATYTATSDGDWYFHIATVDVAGNWTSTQHLGPFRIDTTPPSVPTGLSPASGAYTTAPSPVLSWIASSDPGGSGIDNYRIVVTGPVSRDTYVSDTDYNPTLSEGTFTWKLYARDNAGNASAYSADTTLHIDTTPPDVTIDQAGVQADPANASPVLFTVVFDEPIDEVTFSGADVSVGGTAMTGTVTVAEVVPNDDTTFEVSIAVMGDGTVVPTIPVGGVRDLAGNTNTASTSDDNSVTVDLTRPNVTIDQAAGQADPANASPVLFSVVFDEPIEEATFTGADVSVGGTATTGAVTVTEIAPHDDTTFEVSIVVTGDGTVVPTIPAGGILDLVGNTNTASTSIDNWVRVDTSRPHVEDVTVSDTLLSDADAGADRLTITVEFDESMDPGYSPVLTFSPDVTSGPSATLSNPDGAWDPMTYTAYAVTYDVADQCVDVDSLDIDIHSARDPAGNLQYPTVEPAALAIDTLNPTATIWFDDTLISDADVGLRYYYLNLSFSEDMDTTCGWPNWSFVPNVTTVGGGTGTLGHDTPAGWTSSTTFHRNYAVFDTDDPYKSVSLQLNSAYDLAGNLIEPCPTINADALIVDTENPTVASVAVSDTHLDDLDVSGTFTVAVNFSEAMTTDGSADPAVAFTPNVATTLSVSSAAWVDSDTWEVVYDIADFNVAIGDVDIGVTGASDAVGNAQVAFDAPDRFAIDTLSPPPGSVVVTPAGAAGFLDRGWSEDEEPPMVGELAVSAVFEPGEIITGAFIICHVAGGTLDRPVILTFYRVVEIGEAFDVREALFARYVYCEDGTYAFEIETEGLEPGYYDVRLGLPGGIVQWLRVEVVPPADA